jgi:hypothetical protein
MLCVSLSHRVSSPLQYGSRGEYFGLDLITVEALVATI